MDACIFILTINAMMPVYASDLVTEVDQLGVGDKVCVTRVQNDWVQVHWASGNVGHTGLLHNVTIKQNAQPVEPMQREEEYAVPPQAPQLPEPPLAPSTPQNHSDYRNGPLPPIVRPTGLVMQCFPTSGTPYAVVYINNQAAVISHSGTTRPYVVVDEQDNQKKHVFYVAAKRDDQDRTLYFAFDYSRRSEDISAIRVKASNGYDSRDKCQMDWTNTN
jgi:hypothetical protein